MINNAGRPSAQGQGQPDTQLARTEQLHLQ